jgi:predicted nuclease of restriction endonuclease-like (RecB) superfamily
MEKCKDLLERDFYLRVVKKYGWSKSILIHQIESKACERYLLNQTNFDKALEEKYRHQAKLAVKDSYNFDFLELGQEYDERKLELGLIKNVRSFLLEMGGDLSFIGNQYKRIIKVYFRIISYRQTLFLYRIIIVYFRIISYHY